MSPRPMRVEQALDLLPELEELLPLRAAVIGGARGDEERAWAASAAYATLETRLVDPDALEAAIPSLVEEVARRTEAVYRELAAAVRAARSGELTAAARALVAAGEVEEAAGRLDAAEALFRRALEVGRRPRDRAAEGLALRRLGRVARARGALDEALRLYQQGHEVAQAQRDREGMVVACQGVGNVYGDQGRWPQAGEWYRQGIQLLDGQAPSRALWQLQSNLGVVARKTGDLQGSRRWLDEAARTVAALDDPAGRVYLRNAEGLLRVAEGALERAEASYREGLQDESAAPAARATLLANLADCLLQQGRDADAERVARELERLSLAHGLGSLMPHVYRALGAVARARRDPDGVVFFEQALELSRGLEGSPLEQALTQHEYGQFEAALGAVEAAAARMRAAAEIAERIGAASERDRFRHDLAALGSTGGDGAATEPRSTGGDA